MEAVFKLTRDEVELACAQYLMQRDVKFVGTPKLASTTGQDFEHLFFTGEIALAAPAPAPAPRRVEAPTTPPPPVETPRILPFDLRDVVAETSHNAPAETIEAPPVPAPEKRLRPGQVRSKEASLDIKPGKKGSFGALMSSAPPAYAKLPPGTQAYRATLEE